jgi:outer membrane protein
MKTITFFTRITRNPVCSIFTVLAVILFIRPTSAADLQEIYRLALEHDAQYRQVIAANRATQEQKPQALSQLLPNVSLSAGTQNQNIASSGGFGFGGEFDTNTHNYNFSLNQPVFRWDRYLQLRQAQSFIEQSNAQLRAAELNLIVRVADTYFNILAALDSLAFAQAEKRSLSRQLEQTNQRFEVGLTAITDVQEAKAGYDRAVAAEIAAENNVDNTREALREIIDDYIMDFATLKEEIPLVHPDPDSIEEWTNTALEQNPDILAGMHAVEAARQQVSINRAGHLPSLDLQASMGYNKSGGRFGDNKNKSENIGLQLTVPMFQGGAVSSRARQAIHQLDQELERLTQTRRASQRSTRQAYLGVLSGISQVEALRQAVLSSETALQATQAGYEVGTRTAVDVIAAERNVYQNKRDYARARYDYLVNTLRLKQAAGILATDDVARVNELLN